MKRTDNAARQLSGEVEPELDISVFCRSHESIGSFNADFLSLMRSTPESSPTSPHDHGQPSHHGKSGGESLLQVNPPAYVDASTQRETSVPRTASPRCYSIDVPNDPHAASLASAGLTIRSSSGESQIFGVVPRTSPRVRAVAVYKSTGSSDSSTDGSLYRVDDDDEEEMEDVEHTTSRTKKMSRKRPRRSRARKIYEPEVKNYVEYTDRDVLCQRGGLSNQHPGNLRYRQARRQLQALYFATPKSQRTAVSQRLVDTVHEWGGRFLRKDESSGGWYEVHNHVARTKAGQALREDYTLEELAQKRAKYRRK